MPCNVPALVESETVAVLAHDAECRELPVRPTRHGCVVNVLGLRNTLRLGSFDRVGLVRVRAAVLVARPNADRPRPFGALCVEAAKSECSHRHQIQMRHRSFSRSSGSTLPLFHQGRG